MIEEVLCKYTNENKEIDKNNGETGNENEEIVRRTSQMKDIFK